MITITDLKPALSNELTASFAEKPADARVIVALYRYSAATSFCDGLYKLLFRVVNLVLALFCCSNWQRARKALIENGIAKDKSEADSKLKTWVWIQDCPNKELPKALLPKAPENSAENRELTRPTCPLNRLTKDDPTGLYQNLFLSEEDKRRLEEKDIKDDPTRVNRISHEEVRGDVKGSLSSRSSSPSYYFNMAENFLKEWGKTNTHSICNLCSELVCGEKKTLMESVFENFMSSNKNPSTETISILIEVVLNLIHNDDISISLNSKKSIENKIKDFNSGRNRGLSLDLPTPRREKLQHKGDRAIV